MSGRRETQRTKIVSILLVELLDDKHQIQHVAHTTKKVRYNPMRINSARPIKAFTRKEQEGLRKLLFPTEQPEVFAGSETNDSQDPYRESESAKERKLYSREIEEA